MKFCHVISTNYSGCCGNYWLIDCEMSFQFFSFYIQAAANARLQEIADAELAAQQNSPSCGSAASLEMFRSVHGDGGLPAVDRDRISMKSDCGVNMNRHYSIVLNGQQKVNAGDVMSLTD